MTSTHRAESTCRESGGHSTRHGDVSPCADCAMPTSETTGSYWLASDDLWGRVVGDDTIVLCPRCFHDRAEAEGIFVSWRAVEEEDQHALNCGGRVQSHPESEDFGVCAECGFEATRDVAPVHQNEVEHG